MIDKPHYMNTIHASVLIGAGISSYLLNEKRPVTALIPPVVGSSLLMMNSGIKAGNHTIAHSAVGLTSLLTFMTGKLLLQAVSPKAQQVEQLSREVLQRRAAVFGLMTATGIAAISVYVAGFIAKRREKTTMI